MNARAHDEELQGFFAALREQDAQRPIPPFALPRQRRRHLWRLAPLAAACIALMVWWQLRAAPEAQLERDQIIFSVIQDETGQPRFDIRFEASIDSWSAETDVLLSNP
jgi:hypothetical protein